MADGKAVVALSMSATHAKSFMFRYLNYQKQCRNVYKSREGFNIYVRRKKEISDYRGVFKLPFPMSVMFHHNPLNHDYLVKFEQTNYDGLTTYFEATLPIKDANRMISFMDALMLVYAPETFAEKSAESMESIPSIDTSGSTDTPSTEIEEDQANDSAESV